MAGRLRVAACGGVLAIGLAALGAWLATGDGSARPAGEHLVAVSTTTRTGTAAAAPTVTTRSASTATPAASPHLAGSPIAIDAETLVATVSPGGAPGSQTPGSPPTVELPGQWLGAASVLPVIAQRPGWYQVRLAQRPNESVAWVPAGDVSLAVDSYHIVVDLGAMHLQLFDHGQQVADFPAGIGVPSAPTPTGQFFVALFAQAPSPAYGAFVIVTSAHSTTISDWEESGDAITAIHGSLGSDAAIGTTGAEISHGCIRLHDADLAQLRDVPAGTPIDIVG